MPKLGKLKKKFQYEIHKFDSKITKAKPENAAANKYMKPGSDLTVSA